MSDLHIKYLLRGVKNCNEFRSRYDPLSYLQCKIAFLGSKFSFKATFWRNEKKSIRRVLTNTTGVNNRTYLFLHKIFAWSTPPHKTSTNWAFCKKERRIFSHLQNSQKSIKIRKYLLNFVISNMFFKCL